MKTIIVFVVLIFTFSWANGQIVALSPKGTRVLVDSSKWLLTNTHIVNKNPGNVGIGLNSPAFKLDIAAMANPLRLLGLQNGNATTDSLVVSQNGVIRKLAPIATLVPNRNDSTTASNGLSLVGKDVRWGGALSQPTTIATGGNPLNITGLPNGTAADSLVTVQNGAIRKLAPIATLVPNRNDSTTASNGLSLVGKDVRWGGTLSQPTTIATGGNPLNITGLPNGTAADSLVTVQNGAIRKLAPIATLVPNRNDSTTASNGLSLVGKDVRWGGTLSQPTTIATGGNPLNITGLPNGTAADSLVTVQNGAIRKLAPIATLVPNRNDSTTASNGLSLVGKDVRWGGALSQPTTIATGGNPLNITGLPNGTAADSLVTVQNGAIRKLAPIATLVPNRNDSTTASNGLSLVGKDVRWGGTLSQPTTIATGGNPLNITGLPNGTAADSLVTVQNGAIRKLAPIATLVPNRNDSTTASNGLSLVGKDVRWGGTLSQPTTIATGGNPLNITGLPNGTAADSLVTVQNGAIRKLAPIATLVPNRNDSTTASNGLSLVGKDVRWGGTLSQPTTIATGGNPLNITGLPNGTAADSLVSINSATGQLRRIPQTAATTLAEIYDAAGTQALTTAFTNLAFNSAVITDVGYTTTGGSITVTTPGLYRITLRVTARVSTNNSSGGEFRLTAGGTPIPGSLGYTYHHNANRPNGTVTVVKLANLAANTVITAQGRRYSNNGTLVLVADGSSLLIEKIR